MSRSVPGYRDLVLGTGWTEVVALAAAFVIAVAATPAGISGAVLLLPFQVSVLGTPSPAVTPTNLLYNVVAGTLPGVIAGSVIRVELLPGPHVFDLIAGAVLAPLGIWLALTRPPGADGQDRPPRMIPVPVLVTLSAAVGCIGGIYGIGGGSILAAHAHGSVAPDWPTGIALGTGGLAGAYTGARIQARLPDALIRRLMGILVIAIGARYLSSGLT